MSRKVCLLIKVDSVSYRLNSYPSVSYILQSAEKWNNCSDLKDILVCIDAEPHINLDEISDYTEFEVKSLSMLDTIVCKRIIPFNVRFPLLTKNVWDLVFHSDENLIASSLKGDQITSVEIINDLYSDDASVSNSPSHKKKIMVDDYIPWLYCSVLEN